jgi:hypothetical protein
MVLWNVKKEYIPDAPIPAIPAVNEKDVYTTEVNNNSTIQGFILTCMGPKHQKRYENLCPFDMIKSLETLYRKPRSERYEITEDLLTCKIIVGTLVNKHVINLVGHA